jgi:hypothetical protein
MNLKSETEGGKQGTEHEPQICNWKMEDGGGMSLRNVVLLSVYYTALYPRKLISLKR